MFTVGLRPLAPTHPRTTRRHCQRPAALQHTSSPFAIDRPGRTGPCSTRRFGAFCSTNCCCCIAGRRRLCCSERTQPLQRSAARHGTARPPASCAACAIMRFVWLRRGMGNRNRAAVSPSFWRGGRGQGERRVPRPPAHAGATSPPAACACAARRRGCAVCPSARPRVLLSLFLPFRQKSTP